MFLGPFLCSCKQSTWQLVVSVFYDAFLNEELFSVIKPISVISSEGIESIWSKYLSRLRSKLIAFLIGVTTFLAFLKSPLNNQMTNLTLFS